MEKKYIITYEDDKKTKEIITEFENKCSEINKIFNNLILIKLKNEIKVEEINLKMSNFYVDIFECYNIDEFDIYSYVKIELNEKEVYNTIKFFEDKFVFEKYEMNNKDIIKFV